MMRLLIDDETLSSNTCFYRVSWQLVKDGEWGAKDEHGNWTGMIGEVKKGVSIAQITRSNFTLSYSIQ